MKKQSQHIQYCFIEFSDEQKTVEAKAKLSSDPKLYIDFVGVKSKNGAEKLSKRKIKPPINPTRLHVSGLMKGMDEDKLRKLFPKCSSAVIPKASARKGSNFAFVQFLSPADAKAAFDAAQKLKVRIKKKVVKFTLTLFCFRLKRKRERITSLSSTRLFPSMDLPKIQQRKRLRNRTKLKSESREKTLKLRSRKPRQLRKLQN